MSEPKYYNSNGLSPIRAMKQGLISKEQYKGFLIGNIIKYVIRAGKKEDAIKDLEKAKDYIDFYIEYFMEKKSFKFEPTLTFDAKIDKEDVVKQLKQALEDSTEMTIMEYPTEDPYIKRLYVPPDAFDEDGNLKEEHRKTIKEYLQNRKH